LDVKSFLEFIISSV